MNIIKWLLIISAFGYFQAGRAQPLSVKMKLCQGYHHYPLIVEAEPYSFKKYIEDKGIAIGTQVGHFFTIYPKTDQVAELYRQPFVQRIQDGAVTMKPLLDSSRILNNVDSIHSGFSPLISNYKGRNVLIGIVDFGIEWRHLDFKHSISDSRILGIWDQNKDSIAPSGFHYGHLWRKSDIDSGNCKHIASAQFGHGTNVAGIAAGNGNIRVQNRGMAPESKLVVVSLNNNAAWLTNLIDGVQFIFNMADSLGLPCVVNLSVGDYDGSHDGRDASSRMLESMLHKKGRVIVAAAGNAGNLNQHIRFQPNYDTTFTDFLYTPAYGGTYFNFWADTLQVKDLIMGIQADSPSTLLPLSNSYFFDFQSKFMDSVVRYGYYEDSLDVKNGMDSILGKAYFYVLKQENTVNFQCYIKPKNNAHLWRFMTTGKGIADMWVNGNIQGSSHIQTALPSVSVNPEIAHYKLSDQSMSIVSGFQCSDKIITVGNYVNKYGVLDIDSIYRPIGGKQNEIASNSSKGPTRDGRIKPDIVASGGQTVTTIDSVTASNFSISPTNRKKLGFQGKYSVAGGTSMASPVVTGIIALLFEKQSNLDANQIRYLIKKTSKRDSFTTNIENNTYGYGKINGFQLLRYSPTYGCRDTGSINYNPLSDFEDSSLCIKKRYGCMDTGSINYDSLANMDDGRCVKKVYGCTDTGSINYNPLANIDNGSCIKKVYGCMDSLAENFNPLANVDDGSCQYPSQIGNGYNLSKWNVYPIPARSTIYIDAPPPHSKVVSIQMYNILGEMVYKSKGSGSFSLQVYAFPRGQYFLRIVNDTVWENISIILE